MSQNCDIIDVYIQYSLLIRLILFMTGSDTILNETRKTCYGEDYPVAEDNRGDNAVFKRKYLNKVDNY